MYIGLNHNGENDSTALDRRRVLRRHLIYYLRVWESGTENLLGHIVDITTEGFMLISEKPIDLDKTFDLELKWQSPDDKTVDIRFRAESRWSSNDINKAFYDTGFKFLDVSDELVQPVQSLIEEYGFNR